MKQGTTTNYFLADHLGSTNALTDSTGAITALQSYDSFGNPMNSNFPTRYQFTGREYDQTTRLQFSRARFYDPKLGRFISEDPVGFEGGDVNLYGYVGNSPTGKRDPLGLYEEDVHYYLTYYLAAKSGCFSDAEARYIGFSNHYTDLNPDTSPAFGGSAEQRSRNRSYHALHGGDQDLYKRTLYSRTTGSDRVQALSALGTYLHYEQDTYSHAGYTNSIYGHLFGSHRTDKTATDVEKAMAMAQATLDTLNRFSGSKCGCSGKLTGDVSDTVRRFAEAPGGNAISSRLFSIEQNHPYYLNNKKSILGF